MRTRPDPFDEILRRVVPLMRSRIFPSNLKSSGPYDRLEVSWVGERRGSRWVTISGRAALKATSPTSQSTGPISLELQREQPTMADSASIESPRQKPVGPLFPKPPLARTIQNLFIGKPDATTGEICSMLDDMEEPPKLPAAWKKDPKDRSFVDAYNSPQKGLIDRFVVSLR